jgi:hypothetical protein
MTKRLLQLLVFLPLLPACSTVEEPGQHRFSMESEDGIPVSISSGQPKYEEGFLVFEEIARLEQNEENPETLLYRAGEMLVAEDGRFYVFDGGNSRIAVFGSDGRYQESIGRSGDGPGEFRSLAPLWTTDDVLCVFDQRHLRTTQLRTDGSLLAINTLPPGAARPYQLHPLDDGGILLMYVQQVQAAESASEFWIEAVAASTAGDTMGTLQSPRIRIGKWFRMDRGMGYTQILFGPQSQLLYHPNKGILSCRSDVPELKWFSPTGELKRVMRLRLPSQEVTDAERQAVERIWDERVSNPQNQSMKGYYTTSRELLEFADPKANWFQAVVDDNGFVWLLGHRDYLHEGTLPRLGTHRLLSPQGEYLGDVAWPAMAMRISRGHLLSPQEDEETGEVDYIVYRATSKVAGFTYK